MSRSRTWRRSSRQAPSCCASAAATSAGTCWPTRKATSSAPSPYLRFPFPAWLPGDVCGFEGKDELAEQVGENLLLAGGQAGKQGTFGAREFVTLGWCAGSAHAL